MFEYPSRVGADSGAEFCGYSARGGGPIEEVRGGALDEVFSSVETKEEERGGQLGLSTAAWGSNSDEFIDDCEFLQVRDSTECPEGDLPTRDTHLRHLAASLAGVSPGL
jgi:hypothetical protein